MSAPSELADAMAGRATSPHLVMAVAWGYTLDIYRAFVLSLRRSAGYRGDVKLLAPGIRNKTRPDAIALCEAWRIDLVDFAWLGLGYVPGAMPPYMMGERFKMYDALCSGGGYSWCLAADFRDVVFQADPFVQVAGSALLDASWKRSVANDASPPQFSMPPDLVLPLEDRVIGSCPINGALLALATRSRCGLPELKHAAQ